jgi:hypothetical protein
MAAPQWNSCLSAAQRFFAPPAGCGCACVAAATLQTRSASMRLGPIGHAAFNFLNDLKYRSLVSSTQYNSSRSPLNGAGSWTGNEQIDALFDPWGNVSYSGQRTRNWNDTRTHFSFGGSPVLKSGTYSEFATVDEDGCLHGTWQFSGVTLDNLPWSTSGTVEGRVWAAGRCDDGYYECGAGIGCDFPAINLTATQWDESWQCANSPNGRPGSHTHARTLAQEVTTQDVIGSIEEALPDITSVPWGAHLEAVIRRIDHSSDCEGAQGDTMATLEAELAALQQAAQSATDSLDEYQQQLEDAQQALSDYLAQWQQDHLAWQAEKQARCVGEGEMSDNAFAELEERVFSKAQVVTTHHATVGGWQAAVSDAEAVKATADYFVTLKQNAIAAVNGRWQPTLEAGGAYGWEGQDNQMPLWIDKGHAQARVKIELGHPAQGTGEVFRCTCGSESFDITVPAGEYVAYGPAFTYTPDTPGSVELENITQAP